MSTADVAVPFVRRRPPARVRRKRLLVSVANHSMLIAASIAFLAPFAFIAVTALMTNDQALSANLWPHPFAWHNFVDVFTKAPLWRWTFNTFEYASLATIVVLIALMLPPQVTVVPLYVAWAKFHPFGFNFIGTLWPVIIPNWFGDAFSIFLLRQFFLTIPEEYMDAA